MPRFNLVVETYEGDKLVVTHVFHGDTKAQAKGFYRAHLKSDAFLRGCKAGRFQNFRCHNVIRGFV